MISSNLHSPTLLRSLSYHPTDLHHSTVYYDGDILDYHNGLVMEKTKHFWDLAHPSESFGQWGGRWEEAQRQETRDKWRSSSEENDSVRRHPNNLALRAPPGSFSSSDGGSSRTEEGAPGSFSSSDELGGGNKIKHPKFREDKWDWRDWKVWLVVGVGFGLVVGILTFFCCLIQRIKKSGDKQFPSVSSFPRKQIKLVAPNQKQNYAVRTAEQIEEQHNNRNNNNAERERTVSDPNLHYPTISTESHHLPHRPPPYNPLFPRASSPPQPFSSRRLFRLRPAPPPPSTPRSSDQMAASYRSSLPLPSAPPTDTSPSLLPIIV
eukprot:GHVS01029997.1.p1 GENE.GHVS01029997.1~~GHVS01029997.1.p1  ORF type:complete len:321 (-),score=66.05 GHVS01029997.1:443-1405(-)